MMHQDCQVSKKQKKGETHEKVHVHHRSTIQPVEPAEAHRQYQRNDAAAGRALSAEALRFCTSDETGQGKVSHSGQYEQTFYFAIDKWE